MSYCDECVRQMVIGNPALMLAESERLREEKEQMQSRPDTKDEKGL